jgi:CheY-like chemotaxis protein
VVPLDFQGARGKDHEPQPSNLPRLAVLEKSILVVDDEPDIRFTLADILKALGYSVRVASNGREALENIRAYGAPSIIVLDLMMPVMDGYQFWSEQHQDPKLAQVPVVVITAGTSVRRDELDPFGVVPKPIKLPLLCSLIEKAVGSAVT